MNVRSQRHLVDDVSLAIRQEIHRFESVHPSIYALYELIDALPNFAVPVPFQQEFRRHIVSIEGLYHYASFHSYNVENATPAGGVVTGTTEIYGSYSIQ